MLGGESEARPASAVEPAGVLWTLSLAVATRVALAATLFFVVCGSSSVHDLVRIGSPLRWVALAAFTTLALLWAVSEGVAAGAMLGAGVVGLLLSALGLVSATWSVAPLHTLERGVAFAFVAVGAGAAAAVVGRRSDELESIGETIAATTLVLCLAGVLVYVFDPAIAAEPAHLGTGFRFSGLGESPNTIPMLSTLAAFVSAWLAFVRDGWRRLVHGVAFVVFCAEIAASGSRGAAIAVVAGALVFAAAAPVRRGRPRLAIVTLALVTGASVVAANQLIQNLTEVAIAPVAPAPASSAPAKPPPFPRVVLPTLSSEIGTIPLGSRAFFGKDGRATALQEAFDEGSTRPILGFGFGTEVRAFIKRVAQFQSSSVEDSYLGLFLELGAVGVAIWLLGGAFVLLGLLRARAFPRRERFALAGLVAVVAAGFALGIGESYVYAAGNVATLTFWIAVALSFALPRPRASRAPSKALAAVALVLAVAVPIGIWESQHARSGQNAGMRTIWDRLGSRLDAPTLDGFRLAPPLSCLLYEAGGSPGGYELCFDEGRLVQAIDRRNGRFSAWTVQQWGPEAAALRVGSAAVETQLRRLGGYSGDYANGVGYQTRSVPGG